MKKLFYAAFMAISLALLPACNDNPIAEEGQEVEETMGDFNVVKPDLKYDGKTVILGIENHPKVQKACALFFTNLQSSITDDTKLLIVPGNGKHDAEAAQVLAAGGYVATVCPTDDIFLHVENNRGYECKIFMPDTQTDTDDVEEEDFVNNGTGEEIADFDSIDTETGGNEVYTYLYPWVDDLKNYIAKQREKKESALKLLSESNGSSTEDKMQKLFGNAFHYSFVHPFSGKQRVRKLRLSKPDEIPYSGTASVAFDIYQLHCYQGESGEGDYYVVSMTGSVSNQNMYKGRWRNRHGGTHVRICGLYGKIGRAHV